MATGNEKRINDSRECRFIAPEYRGNDLFAYYSSIRSSGLPTLIGRQRMNVDITATRKGQLASSMRGAA